MTTSPVGNDEVIFREVAHNAELFPAKGKKIETANFKSAEKMREKSDKFKLANISVR